MEPTLSAKRGGGDINTTAENDLYVPGQVEDYVEESFEYRWSFEWSDCGAREVAAALCQAGFGRQDVRADDGAFSSYPLDADCLSDIAETETVMEYRFHLEKGKTNISLLHFSSKN